MGWKNRWTRPETQIGHRKSKQTLREQFEAENTIEIDRSLWIRPESMRVEEARLKMETGSAIEPIDFESRKGTHFESIRFST